MSGDTFCRYCGASTNPTYSDHREETCSKKPRTERPASSNESCARCNQPRFTCVCTPEELEAFEPVKDSQPEAADPSNEPPIWETPSHEELQLGEPHHAPEVFHLDNNLALADYLDQNLDDEDEDATISDELRLHFAEAFTQQLQTRSEYILENFIVEHGLSIAQAKPVKGWLERMSIHSY